MYTWWMQNFIKLCAAFPTLSRSQREKNPDENNAVSCYQEHTLSGQSDENKLQLYSTDLQEDICLFQTVNSGI